MPECVYTLDMNHTTETTVRLTRDGDQYRYSNSNLTAVVWKVDSDYGDIQWVCDIDYCDGRFDTFQCDTLGWVRHNLALIINAS